MKNGYRQRFRSGWYSDGCREKEMASGNPAENPQKRKIHRRCPSSEDLHGGFLEKKRVPNNGLVSQYYVENSHEAIIPRELYMQVQEEMVRRANLHSGQNRKKRVYSSKYALSSIVYCSKCGDIYRRVVWNNRGKHSIVWRCCTRVEHILSLQCRRYP